MKRLRISCADEAPRLLRLEEGAETGAWLVAADEAGRALAALRLVPALGMAQPRPFYRLGCVVHAAPELKLHQRQRTLLLGHDLTGAAELADFAWDATVDPAERADAMRTLLRAALMHVAMQRDRFGPQLAAELPGLTDDAGRSPFWLGLGSHFYGGDPQEAMRRFGASAWRTHVAELLPRQPVYLSFLPPAAQQAAGHSTAAVAWLRGLLEDEGLRHRGHVRVDDAGPVLESEVDLLPAVRGTALCTLGDPVQQADAQQTVLLAHGGAVHRVPAAPQADRLRLAASDANALGLQPGMRAWALPDR